MPHVVEIIIRTVQRRTFPLMCSTVSIPVNCCLEMIRTVVRFFWHKLPDIYFRSIFCTIANVLVIVVAEQPECIPETRCVFAFEFHFVQAVRLLKDTGSFNCPGEKYSV